MGFCLLVNPTLTLLGNISCMCLGPIARPQQCIGVSHSKAAAHPCSPLITSCICIHIIITSLYSTAMNILDEPQPCNNLFICTLRHGGSAEPALPMAVLNQSERKRRGTAYNPSSVHSWIIAQERVGTATIGIFMHTTGSQHGSRRESRIRQRTMDTHDLNHLCSQGVCFEF